MKCGPRVGRLSVLFVVATQCLLLASANAETHVAVDLTPTAVWNAINAAKDGDVVQLPEGKAVWEHGWNFGHLIPMKAITIQGAGIDKTIIVDNTSAAHGDGPFWFVGVEGKPFRLTGITLDGTGFEHADGWLGMITITGNCKNFRIDHCELKNTYRFMYIIGLR